MDQHGARRPAGGEGATSSAGATPAAAARTRPTWLPVLTFLAGAGITAAAFLIGDAARGSDTEDGTAAPALASEQPQPVPEETDPALLVRVPAVCVQAAEYTDTVTAALGEIAGAARDLDARRLAETLDAVQQLSPDVEAAARECRELAAQGQVIPAASPEPVSPADSPSPEPTPEAPEPSGTPAPDVTGEPTPTTAP